MTSAWLDAPPRRRLPVPSRDLAAGVAVGLGLCVVALGLAASMQLVAATAPEPSSISVSIGVQPVRTTSGGGRPGQPGPGRAQQGPTASAQAPRLAAPEPTPSTPMATTASPRTKRPVVLPNLPGLGDLEGPPSDPGDAHGEGSRGGADGGDGGGDGGSGGSGAGDAALATYRARLAAWLSARFHVEGSGLGARELKALRVRANLHLSEDRVVMSYDLEPTGTDTIDEAARRALDSVLGQPTPEPPPGYGAVQRQIRVTFVCRPGTCS